MFLQLQLSDKWLFSIINIYLHKNFNQGEVEGGQLIDTTKWGKIRLQY